MLDRFEVDVRSHKKVSLGSMSSTVRWIMLGTLVVLAIVTAFAIGFGLKGDPSKSVPPNRAPQPGFQPGKQNVPEARYKF